MVNRYSLSALPLLLAVFVCVCFHACQRRVSDPGTEEIDLTPPELPADFIAFYRAFHSDSTFQTDHITFPLPGMGRDTAGRDSTIYWSQQNWILHNPVVPDDFWKVDFTMPLNNTVVEYIHSANGAYWMERRFAKMSGEWYLIYYSDLKGG